MVRCEGCGSNNGHHKEMCSKEIELGDPNMSIILDSVINIIIICIYMEVIMTT